MTPVEKENALSTSIMYFVSRRGLNSFWASVVNSCDKVYRNDEGTLSVSLAQNHRFILTVHLPFYKTCSEELKYLVLVHEAAHLVLLHIPRFLKLISDITDPFVRTAVKAVANIAMDLAANDSVVRLEKQFEKVHRPSGTKTGEWTFLLPEEFGFEKGKTMEEYICLILNDLPKMKQQVDKMLKALEKQLQDEIDGKGQKEEQGEGQDGDGSGSEDVMRSPYGNGRGGRPASVPGLPESLIEQAINEPETFERFQKLFDQLTGKNHKSWGDKLEKMSPEEAVSAGNKMKKHAQTLAKAAAERTSRERGYLPNNMQRLIEELMQEEVIPWDVFLRDIIQSSVSSRVREEMVSPNLALINEDYLEPWPGQTLDFNYNITWFSDTSGSMGDDEYARACSCLNSLLAINKGVHVTYVEGDAALQKEVQVTNLEPPDEKYLEELRKRRGYGGTNYAPFFKRVAGEDTPGDWMEGAPRLDEKHPYPDLIVVCTDGGVTIEEECFPKYRPNCPVVWILMPGCRAAEGMSNVSPDRVIETFHMREE
jgi:predicted metal-dependent peptidase